MTDLQRVRTIRRYTEHCCDWRTIEDANWDKNITLIFATIHGKPKTTTKLRAIIENANQQVVHKLEREQEAKRATRI